MGTSCWICSKKEKEKIQEPKIISIVKNNINNTKINIHYQQAQEKKILIIMLFLSKIIHKVKKMMLIFLIQNAQKKN